MGQPRDSTLPPRAAQVSAASTSALCASLKPVPKARLGVALLIPPPFAAEVDALRRAMADPALDRIPPHLTLVPPVNVRDDALDDALAVLRDAAAQTRPMTIAIGPPTTFLPVNPVLYLAVGGDLDAVSRLRERVFRPPLERSLTWPFMPHVTIADEADPARIEAALVAMAGYRRAVTIDRVHLLREGEGRRWQPIADVPFTAPAVVGRGPLELVLSTTDALGADGWTFAEREWPLFNADRYGPDWPAEQAFAITARRHGDVVGYAEGFVQGQRALLGMLMVGAAHRGEGIGSHLLAAFESHVQVQGALTAQLHTERDGQAERFYLDRGWRRKAVIADWPWGDGRDFVQLERRFG